MSKNREDVIKCVEDLYRFRDLYMEEHSASEAPNKEADIDRKMKETLKLVEENEKLLKNKAEFYILKGKCLNVTANYNDAAEEALSKAVKLDPKHVDAWNVLGECFWKKGDIESAKNCFSGALQHSINKVSLRNLSMVLRQFGSSREEKFKHINESVTKAKEAVELDISDGTSWFILGNAYLAQFFAGTQNENVIKLCMKAYAQAEKDPVARNNPDLYFNRSMCFLYQSDFEEALLGFKKARSLDPTWDEPTSKVNMLTSYLQSVSRMVDSKCGMTGKNKLQKMMSNFNETQLGPYSGGAYTSPLGKSVTLEKKSLNSLTEGPNSNIVICCKVLGCLATDPAIPYTFIIIDENMDCLAVCLYNLSASYGLKAGDSIAIPEPYLMKNSVAFSDSNDKTNLTFIRVETPLILVVNGKKLGIEKQAPTVLKVTTQSE